MRPPVNALGAELRRSAEAARTAMARDLYALEALRDRMTKAAAAGFGFVLIEGPDGLDLRGTKAAKAAEAWLLESKLAASFDAKPNSAGPDGQSGWNLVISWAQRALPAP